MTRSANPPAINQYKPAVGTRARSLPLFPLASESKASLDALRVTIESGVFVVNVLSQSQRNLSERFAAPAEDKFGDVEFHPGIEGIPVLNHALANVECRLKHAHDGGDHAIFVGEVESVTIGDGDPLVYFHHDYTGVKR